MKKIAAIKIKLLINTLIICGVLLTANNTFSQDYFKVVRDDHYGNIELQNTYIYCDSSNLLDINDIASGKLDTLFTEYVQHNTFLKPNYSYWVKFNIKNSSNENLIYLMFNTKLIEADLYTPLENNSYQLQRSGLKWSFRKWYLKYKNLLFAISGNPLPEGESYLLRIRTSDKTTAVILPYKHRTFFNKTLSDYYVYGIFFGIILIAALYTLIFYMRMREVTYLFYCLYVLSFAGYAFVDFGLALNFLAVMNLQWTKDLYTIPFSMITISLLLYANSFLSLRKEFITGYFLLLGLVVIRVFIYFTGLIFDLNQLYNPGIDFLLLAIAFIIAIARLIKGFKPARYLVLAWSVLLFGLFLHALRYQKQDHVLEFFSLYRVGVAEIILFSFALADRFRALKSDKEESQARTILALEENTKLQEEMIKQLSENEKLKDAVNKDLGNKVKDRTRELEEANLQIQEMNILLKKANIKLEGDVERISRSRVMQNRVTFEEFKEIYPTEESCFELIEKLKWENGFTCKKCGNRKYSKGTTPYSRRCSKCNYIERITSDTIFSRTKFPITKAFYILFLISSEKNQTVDELSDMVSLRRQTCWLFKKKVEKIINQHKKKIKKRDSWTQLIFLTEKPE